MQCVSIYSYLFTSFLKSQDFPVCCYFKVHSHIKRRRTRKWSEATFAMFKMSATSLSWSHSLSVHQPLLCRKVVLLTDFIKHYIQFQWHQLSAVYLTSLVFSVIGIKLNHILVLFLYFPVKFLLVIKMFVFYHVSSKFT